MAEKIEASRIYGSIQISDYTQKNRDENSKSLPFHYVGFLEKITG